MKSFIALTFSLLGLMPTSYAAENSHVVYDYIGPPDIIYDDEDKSVRNIFATLRLDLTEKTVTIQDAVLPLDVCAADDKWFCIFGSGLYFAVDKSGITNSKWTYKGFAFEDIGKQKISIFGQEHVVDVITAYHLNEASPKTISVAYYTVNDGLLGFSIVSMDPSWTETYFLKGTKGFAAKK